jgi:hypothetical protein
MALVKLDHLRGSRRNYLIHIKTGRLRDQSALPLYYAVDSFSGLQRESPENGSFLGLAWRLSGILGPKSSNTGLWRLSAMRKARIWRAFLIKERKFSENKNAWLATQCRSHPSPAKFPANREFFRESAILEFSDPLMSCQIAARFGSLCTDSLGR